MEPEAVVIHFLIIAAINLPRDTLAALFHHLWDPVTTTMTPTIECSKTMFHLPERVTQAHVQWGAILRDTARGHLDPLHHFPDCQALVGMTEAQRSLVVITRTSSSSIIYSERAEVFSRLQGKTVNVMVARFT